MPKVFLAQVLVFIVRLLVGEDNGLNPIELATASPVRLIKDAVNLWVVDDSGLHSDRFDHATNAEVFDGSEVARTYLLDQLYGLVSEGRMW